MSAKQEDQEDIEALLQHAVANGCVRALSDALHELDTTETDVELLRWRIGRMDPDDVAELLANMTRPKPPSLHGLAVTLVVVALAAAVLSRLVGWFK